MTIILHFSESLTFFCINFDLFHTMHPDSRIVEYLTNNNKEYDGILGTTKFQYEKYFFKKKN